MPQLGPLEVVVILVVALLVFGPNRLPQIGRQVGQAFRELRRVQHDVRKEMSGLLADDLSEHAAPAPTLGPKAAGTPPSPLPAGPGAPAPSRFAPPAPPPTPTTPPAGAAPPAD